MSEPRSSSSPSGAPTKPRLLDRVRLEIRTHHYNRRTEEAYLFWIRRSLASHGMRQPDTMGSAEVGSFLSDPTTRCRVSASKNGPLRCSTVEDGRKLLGHRLELAFSLLDAGLDLTDLVAGLGEERPQRVG